MEEIEPMEPTDKPAALIDWTVALEATGDDQPLLDELVTVFLDEAPMLLRQSREALQQIKDKEFQRAAHTLKGSLRLFGAAQGVELAQRLELLGGKNELDSAGPLLDEFETYMARFLEELKARRYR